MHIILFNIFSINALRCLSPVVVCFHLDFATRALGAAEPLAYGAMYCIRQLLRQSAHYNCFCMFLVWTNYKQHICLHSVPVLIIAKRVHSWKQGGKLQWERDRLEWLHKIRVKYFPILMCICLLICQFIHLFCFFFFLLLLFNAVFLLSDSAAVITEFLQCGIN